MKKRRETEKNLNLGPEEDDNKLYGNITRLDRSKKAGFNKKFALACCLGLIVLAVYLNWGSLSPKAVYAGVTDFAAGFGKSRYPAAFSDGTFKDAVPLDANIGVLTDSAFLIYSPTGKVLVRRMHGLSDPHIVSSGGNAVIFDSGGRQLRVETLADEPFTITTQYPITSAAVSSRGVVAVVTSSNDYLSEMTVYSASQKQLFKWYCSTGRIISVSLSPDGTKAAALTVTAENGDIESALAIYDLRSQKPVGTARFSGKFLFSVTYTGPSSLTAVGKTDTLFFDGAAKQVSDYSYSDKTLKFYRNEPGGAILLFSRYGIGRESTLVTLEKGGKSTGQTNLTSEITSLGGNKNGICVLSPGSVTEFDASCGSPVSHTVPEDATKLLCNQNYVYIFGPAAVYQYKLK